MKKVALESEGGEIYKRGIEKTSISMNSGKVQQVDGKKTEEIALRIIKDNSMGTAVSTSIEDESIIERALISSRYQKSEPITFSSSSPSKVQCFDDRVERLSSEELVSEAKRINDIIYRIDPSIMTKIEAEKRVENIHIMNTAGFDHSYRKTNYSVGFYTKTQKGFVEVDCGLESAAFKDISEEQIMKVIKKHHVSQNRVSVKTGRMPIIFSGQAFGALMMRLLSGVNGSNIVKGISPLQGRIGEKIMADGITVRDNGILEYGFGTCPFDDEGVPTSNTVIVEDGVLKNYLIDTSDGKKLGIKSTGNSFRGTMFSKDIEDSPAIGSTNLVIEGKGIPDYELINSVDKGIYIDSVMGQHSGNIPAGEYSLNVGCGFLIENGKFTGKVMNAMVAGNIYEDLNKIMALGTEKENMAAIFYNIGYSPAVLFSDLNVIGDK